MEYYPMWISSDAINRARTEFKRARAEFSNSQVSFGNIDRILSALEKSIAVGIRGNPGYEDVLQWRCIGASYDIVTRQTGVQVINLLNIPPTSTIPSGGNVYEIWTGGGEIVLDPGDKDVADVLGTSHIPVGKVSNEPKKIHFSESSTSNKIMIDFSLGCLIDTAHVPKNLNTEQLAKIQNLLETYQRNIQNSVNLGSARAIRDSYPSCESHRNRLYQEIENLGWQLQDSVTQVYDTRFREWNTQEDKWNIFRVLAHFRR